MPSVDEVKSSWADEVEEVEDEQLGHQNNKAAGRSTVGKGAVSVAKGAVSVAKGSVSVAKGAVPVAKGVVPVAKGVVPVAKGGSLPPAVEKNDGTTKTVTDFSVNDDGKKIKVVSHYRIEKHRVAKTIAERKTWRKYGLSKNDKPGPNPATTITAEDVFMHFLSNKEEEQNEQEELKKKLMDAQKGQVKCRLCKEDHWTKQCPYKDKLEPLRTSLLGEQKEEEEASQAGGGPPGAADKSKMGGVTQGKYVPPSMRDGGSKKGESMMSARGRDETATVRVTNLSENTREQDLQDLFRPFGDISRIFLAKDKNTGQSKGFAFINFKRREDAAKAIHLLNGYGYDHLILSVEWAKPSGTQ